MCRSNRIIESSSPCFATTITSPWVASSIRPPPLLDQPRELPGTTRRRHGHWHVVSGEELQALGPDRKVVDTAYPTDFDIVASRPTSTSLPPRHSASGLGSLLRRAASALRGLPPRRMSGFGCFLALLRGSGPFVPQSDSQGASRRGELG